MADRIAIMNEGSIVQTGTLKEIMEAPKNEFVARFVKTQNIFSGVSDGSTVRIGQTALARKNTLQGDVIVAIRPENIAIIENDDKRRNVFSGEVKSTKLKPYFTEISVNTGIPLEVITQTEKEYRQGDTIKVWIPEEKVVVLKKS